MIIPLIVLSTVTIGLGFISGPISEFLSGSADEHTAAHPGWLLPASIVLEAAGIVIAWLEFGRKRSRRVGFIERFAPLHRLFAERWYIDRFYRWMLDRVVYGTISRLFTTNDNRVIDGGIDAMGKGTIGGSWLLSLLHAGMIQYKLMVLFAVVILLGLYVVF
jgi:NADH-quinone oxidoreductase subunit L